ncbi:MAG: DUF2807 domain-containing protein [Firmicutes bacterium]|nr:DUF2807 domain-containing protein [Bacillota bacterium]
MKKLITLLTLALLLSSAFFFTGCNGGTAIIGVGNMTERDFVATENFSSIRVSGGFDIRFSYSEDTTVRIVMQENLFEFTTTRVSNNTLYVQPTRSFNTVSVNRPRLYVSSPNFNAARLSGSTRLRSDDVITGERFNLHTSGSSRVELELDVDRLEITTSGSSNIELTVSADYMTVNSSGSATFNLEGTALNTAIETSGSATINALDLLTINTTIESSGSARIFIYVRDSLTVYARGSSRIRFMGNPTRNTHTRGSSTVERYQA